MSQVVDNSLRSRVVPGKNMDRSKGRIEGYNLPTSAEVEKEATARRTEEQEIKKEIQRLGFRSPLRTLYLFGCVICKGVQSLGHYLLERRAKLLYPLLAALITYLLAAFIPGPHSVVVRELEKYVKYLVWWTGLGVLSSIGLGTGMHSGLLFLFPHILKITVAAERCGSLHFDSRINMWQASIANKAEFVCPRSGPDGSVTYLGIVSKAVVAAFLWGAGTAIGEVPPYWVAYTASMAGKSSQELEEVQDGSGVISRMKQWMIVVLEKFGFWGVLAMAAWPNAAFDLCGICCGQFLMPFWTFFSGVFVGKACIKAPMQNLVAVIVFHSESRSKLLSVIFSILPRKHSEMIKSKLEGQIEKLMHIRDPVASAAAGAPPPPTSLATILPVIWNYLVLSLVGYFAVSCIIDLAKNHRRTQSNEELDVKYPLTAMEKETKSTV